MIDECERWYLCITQPNRESDACWHLRRQGYTTFFPRRWQQYTRDHKASSVLLPLFPGYLFAAVKGASQSVGQIRETIGVRSVLYEEIRPELMDELRLRYGQDGIGIPQDEAGEHLRSLIQGLGEEVAGVLLAAFGGVRSLEIDRPRQERGRNRRRRQRKRLAEVVSEPAGLAA